MSPWISSRRSSAHRNCWKSVFWLFWVGSWQAKVQEGELFPRWLLCWVQVYWDRALVLKLRKLSTRKAAFQAWISASAAVFQGF